MTLAILQARVSSSRLPGKVLKPILGQPMLFRQIERVWRAKLIDRFMVATSDNKSDDAIEHMCATHGVAVFRGSLDDVLDRFYHAALPVTPDYVVRLTGDCPLIDPEVIDRVIDACIRKKADYASNTLTVTFPDGLDVEVMTYKALDVAWREATLPSQREHVTPFIWSQPNRFKLVNVVQESDLSGYRWTVDEPVDFEMVRSVYEQLYPAQPGFSTADVLELLERVPEIAKLNTGFVRNEGYAKSLLEDAELRKHAIRDTTR